MTDFESLPICIFGFDRPHYIEPTLKSIRRSSAVAGMMGPVILFHDGHLNPRTGEKKADPAQLAESRRMFLDVFPGGIVMGTDNCNLGIARNIYRGERWVFEEAGYDCGLFFEDDMVLSDGYFSVMRKLFALARENERIAMFSAYGYDGLMSLEEQYLNRESLGAMHHNWGFGLMRHAWAARERYTSTYMQLLMNVDYRDRPLIEVARWYADLGWPPLPTNQDLVKNVVLNSLGYVRITPAPIFAKYIGETGQHYTPEDYSQMGFDRAELYEDKYPVSEVLPKALTEPQVKGQILTEREKFLRLRLSPAALLQDAGFARMSELMTISQTNFGLTQKSGKYVQSVLGLFQDLWFGPNGSFAFNSALRVTGVEITGIFGGHLPADAIIRFSAASGDEHFVSVEPGTAFSIAINMPSNFDLLLKSVSTQCSHIVDPFSKGMGSDRRALAWRITKLIIRMPDGSVTLRDEDLEREFYV